jgi:hypothetical protein
VPILKIERNEPGYFISTMKAKNKKQLSRQDQQGELPKHEEILQALKKKVKEGYYNSERAKKATAEAFLEHSSTKRAKRAQ